MLVQILCALFLHLCESYKLIYNRQWTKLYGYNLKKEKTGYSVRAITFFTLNLYYVFSQRGLNNLNNVLKKLKIKIKSKTI